MVFFNAFVKYGTWFTRITFFFDVAWLFNMPIYCRDTFITTKRLL